MPAPRAPIARAYKLAWWNCDNLSVPVLISLPFTSAAGLKDFVRKTAWSEDQMFQIERASPASSEVSVWTDKDEILSWSPTAGLPKSRPQPRKPEPKSTTRILLLETLGRALTRAVQNEALSVEQAMQTLQFVRQELMNFQRQPSASRDQANDAQSSASD